MKTSFHNFIPTLIGRIHYYRKKTPPIYKNTLNRLIKYLWRKRYLFRQSRYNEKIFCVGYRKTGTTSLGEVFKSMGLFDTGFHRKFHELYSNKKYGKLIKIMAKFDSTSDIPWSEIEMIPLLYDSFPNSKFIYLERDPDSWFSSYAKHLLRYLDKPPSKTESIETFLNHREFVADFFSTKDSNCFLSIDISEKNSLELLEDFIGRKSKLNSIPHANKTRTSAIR